MTKFLHFVKDVNQNGQFACYIFERVETFLDCWQSVFLSKFQQGLRRRPYHPVSPSSLQGQRHLRSRWLNARPSDPLRKKPAASRLCRWLSFPWKKLDNYRAVFADKIFETGFTIKVKVNVSTVRRQFSSWKVYESLLFNFKMTIERSKRRCF